MMNTSIMSVAWQLRLSGILWGKSDFSILATKKGRVVNSRDRLDMKSLKFRDIIRVYKIIKLAKRQALIGKDLRKLAGSENG